MTPKSRPALLAFVLVGCSAEPAEQQPLSDPPSGAGKADEVFPTGVARGELVVKTAEPLTDGDLYIRWEGDPVPPSGSVVAGEGCMVFNFYPDSRSIPATGGTICDILVEDGGVTEVVLPTFRLDWDHDTEIDVGWPVEFGHTRRPDSEFALFRKIPRDQVFPIAPGEFVLGLGEGDNFSAVGWGEVPFTVPYAEHVELELSSEEVRTTVELIPPPERALPDDRCIVAPAIFTTAHLALEGRELDPNGDVARFFPGPNHGVRVSVAGIPIPLDDAAPGEAIEVPMYRLDVHAVPGVWDAIYVVYRRMPGTDQQLGSGCSVLGLFEAGRGIDLPAGDYDIYIFDQSDDSSDPLEHFEVSLGTND